MHSEETTQTYITQTADALTGISKGWPKSLDEKAFLGIIGKYVKEIRPQTEADPAAIILQCLALAGNIIGGKPRYPVGQSAQYSNLYVLIVGESAQRGRKGTSLEDAESLFAPWGWDGGDPKWFKERKKSGLSTGEGIIAALKEEEERRLMVVESEFASAIRICEREGNNLSATIRSAWDHRELSIINKSSPLHVTNPHLSIIGHITPNELKEKIKTTELANGFANRFLFALAHRTQVIPIPKPIEQKRMNELRAELFTRINEAKQIAKMNMSDDARELWIAKYSELSNGAEGLLGAVLGRSEAQVIRLGMVYALLDGSSTLTFEHLAAGLEIWRYCGDSARYLFSSGLGDKTADRILEFLRTQQNGQTYTKIRRVVFNDHPPVGQIIEALNRLAEKELAKCEGKLWFAVH